MRSLLILFILVILAVCAWIAHLRTHSARHLADRFEKEVRSTVDPNHLQTWATRLLGSATNEYNGGYSPYLEFGRIMSNYGPVNVAIQGGGQEEKFVCISWGAAAGQWGLAIGAPSFVPCTPEHGDSKWTPGIYFWRQLH